MQRIRGVNLGGWLVLEPWMTPSLFKGIDAQDEHGFCKDADRARRKALKRHRDSFIDRDDFHWMALRGLNAVRLPIGHWAFGDEPPYEGCIEYVDKAFEWAEEFDLKVLLSVHGVPESQNGQDHSGFSGQIGWHKDPVNAAKSLAFVTQLAERYGQRPALYGIELMNEPSRHLPKRLVQRYYRQAYKQIRAITGAATKVVFSDGYQAWRWPFTLGRPMYRNTVIDTHRYAVYLERDKRRSAAVHILLTSTWLAIKLRYMRLFHEVIVGEWSAALDERSLKGLSPARRQETYKAYVAAQMLAFGATSGWFFWNYKTENDDGPWSYRHAYAQGWLPEPKSDSENA